MLTTKPFVQKRHGILYMLSVCFIIMGIFGLHSSPKILIQFENTIKDSFFVIRGEAHKDNRVAVIDIDEKSLKELGQWPWSRDVLATIIDNLTQSQVAAIGMDVVFSEPDRSSPQRVLRYSKLPIKTTSLPDYDAIFANSLSLSPVVSGYIFSTQNDGVQAQRSPRSKAIIIEKNKPESSFLPNAHRPILNISSIENSTYSSGFLNSVPDYDGIVRSAPSIIKYNDILYPSLSVELIRLVTKAKTLTVQYNQAGVEHLLIGQIKIPTDLYGNIRINYTGQSPAYTYLSAVDIYNKQFDPSDLAHRIVLLGTSSAGLYDLKSSPFNAVLPGVEVHAHLLDNILNQNIISKPQWGLTFDILSIFVLMIILLCSLLSERFFISSACVVILVFTVLIAHYILMFHYGLIFNTAFLLFSLLCFYFLGTLVNYLYVYKNKELIKQKFSKKVSKQVMESLINQHEKLGLQGETKEVSIFFSDIRNFTQISEQMPSPKILIKFLNRYMTPMTDIIISNQGTVDKFIGDSIMAYWNAPNELSHHANHALNSAIEQLNALEQLNAELQHTDLPKINIGIGLNTGKCIVGEMGSLGRSDYTCIGDAVNLASRLEVLNKKHKTQIILSEFFVNALHKPEQYVITSLGKEIIKGKTKPVRVYSCTGYT